MKPDIEFPFGSRRQDYDGIGGKILAWLRDHGSYLSPGNGLNIWSLIGAFLGAVMVNLLILAPMFLLSVYLIYLAAQHKISFAMLSAPYNILFLIGAFFVLWYIAKVILYILNVVWKKRPDFDRQRKERGSAGKVLMYGVLILVISSIPAVHCFLLAHLTGWIGTVSISTVFAGILSFVSAYRESKKRENEPIGFEKLFLTVGVSLVLYGLVIWIYHLFYLGQIGVDLLLPLLVSFGFGVLIFTIAHLLKKEPKWALGISVLLLAIAIGTLWLWLSGEAHLPGAIGIVLLFSLPISALFAAFTKINYVSMHRYYRNRLMEAYLPWSVVGVSGESADKFSLTKLKEPEKTPYLIINTNVNMVGSDSTRQRKRGGDNFIFSPLFCGSDITGYRETDRYASGKMNLATAFAISGAAVDPNTYATRSKPISFAMSLLNARLGYWIENPREKSGAETIGWNYYLSIFKELFGKGLNEHETYIHLADGGHFENLGLYELIRRKCRYIIVSDAGKDPRFTFGYLAKVIELARVDFGAEIKIDTRPLRPDEKHQLSKTAFILGTVRYHDGKIVDIIYVKTTMIEGLSEDIYSYRRTNPKFPDQTTTDQFFDEMQFEAYRELGYQIGKNLCKNEWQEDFSSIFRG
ncbi:MAG TPA: hypothetical protein ENL02_04465 [Epsilonproteobacteria bacterium]|nr:hypothetical protein [Campylobacterota bacterium]